MNAKRVDHSQRETSNDAIVSEDESWILRTLIIRG